MRAIASALATAVVLAACSSVGHQVRVADAGPSGRPLPITAQLSMARDALRTDVLVDFAVVRPEPSPQRSPGLPVAGPVPAPTPTTAPASGSSTLTGPVDPWRLPAAVVVDLARQRARVLDPDGVELAVLPVSSGGPGNETPVGSFEVVGRQRLGTAEGNSDVHMDFFTVFNGDIGFHGIPWVGTPEDRLWTPLGEYGVSHGCIRMADADAEYLYTFLPDGAPVLVVG